MPEYPSAYLRFPPWILAVALISPGASEIFTRIAASVCWMQWVHPSICPYELVHRPFLLQAVCHQESCHAELHLPICDLVVLFDAPQEQCLMPFALLILLIFQSTSLMKEQDEQLETGVAQAGQASSRACFWWGHYHICISRSFVCVSACQSQEKRNWGMIPWVHPWTPPGLGSSRWCPCMQSRRYSINGRAWADGARLPESWTKNWGLMHAGASALWSCPRHAWGVGQNGFPAGSEIAKGCFASWDRCLMLWVCLEGNGWESRILTLALVFLCVSIPRWLGHTFRWTQLPRHRRWETMCIPSWRVSWWVEHWHCGLSWCGGSTKAVVQLCLVVCELSSISVYF